MNAHTAQTTFNRPIASPAKADELRPWTEAQARTVIAVAQAEIDRRVAKLRECPIPWNLHEIRNQNGLWSDVLFAAAAVLDQAAGHEGFENAQEELWEAIEAVGYSSTLSSALHVLKSAERAVQLGLAA